MRWPAQAVLTLPPEPASAAAARRFTRRTLRAWDTTLGDSSVVRDTAELLVSELVANGIRHARTSLDLRLETDGERLRVELRDWGPGHPRPRLPSPEQESGRGLYLVDRLAADWGVREERVGKTVWFQLDGVGAGTREPVGAGSA